MIESYLEGRDTLRRIVVLVDGDLGAQPSDSEMVAWARSLGRDPVVVATKLDRLGRTRRPARIKEVAAAVGVEEAIAFSAKEKFGVDEMWKGIAASGGPRRSEGAAVPCRAPDRTDLSDRHLRARGRAE